MSSLQRSRSLRKPSTSSSSSSSRNAELEPRNGSPSRLPVKPLTRSATVSASSRTLRSSQTNSSGLSNASGLTRTASVRQADSSGLTRAASVRQRQPVHEPVRRETSRYPPSTATTEPVKRETSRHPVTTEPAKREMSRYPPSTTTTRPRPTARPTSSDGPTTQTRRVPSHTRAKSTTTTIRTAPVLRPPSQNGPAATGLRTTRSSRTSSPEEKLAPQSHPRLRPAFSTLQQHYSPAKSSAPKPLTSTFLAPPSPSKLPANVAASAETSKLQTEVLQLHLLHRGAATTDAEWRASAKTKLGDRFAELAVASREVDDKERAEVERENVLAFRAWAADGGLEERIQALDGMMSGLWTMGEAGGRYARVVRRFERWIDRVTEIEDARRSENLLLHDQDVLFLGDLDASWKDECAGLKRKLDGWKRQLHELGQVPDDGESSLRRMMDGSRTLIHNLLEELQLMEGIERDALEREDAWIERMNRAENGDDTPRAGAIWRVV